MTTDFKQTNWWVTSFTPSVQSPNVKDLLKVNMKASFIDVPVHKNLFQFFKAKGNIEHVNNRWGAVSWIQNSTEGYQFEVNY